MTEITMTSSHCECGALELHVKHAPVVQLVCHCSDCRSFSGMPYSDLAFFQSDGCSVHGEVSSTTMKGGTGIDKSYHSCTSCKTPLYGTVGALNGAWVILANRLFPFKFEPQAHIWTSEKTDDAMIPAGIAQSAIGVPTDIKEVMLASFWGNE